MTATRSSVVAAALIAALGCGDQKPGKRTNTELEEGLVAESIAELASPDPAVRASGAGYLNLTCCDRHRDEWRPELAIVRPRACAALVRVLESEHDPTALEGALGMHMPACNGLVPTEVLLRLSAAGVDASVRWRAIAWLKGADPSPALAAALLDRVEPVGAGRDRSLHRGYLTQALTGLGEDDLSPLLDALRHSDVAVRDFALTTLSFASREAPLDMPEAIVALDHMAKTDPDKELAEYAAYVLREFRERRHRSPDEIVRLWASDTRMYHDRIRLLGTRRFSCRATNAKQVLERLANGSDPQRAIGARNALVIRAGRCRDW